MSSFKPSIIIMMMAIALIAILLTTGSTAELLVGDIIGMTGISTGKFPQSVERFELGLAIPVKAKRGSPGILMQAWDSNPYSSRVSGLKECFMAKFNKTGLGEPIAVDNDFAYSFPRGRSSDAEFLDVIGIPDEMLVPVHPTDTIVNVVLSCRKNYYANALYVAGDGMARKSFLETRFGVWGAVAPFVNQNLKDAKLAELERSLFPPKN